ncbi:MAG: hypothetical protein Q8N37_01745 [bacterium]|nr:hypothetical protein [bacterium]
MPNFYGKPGKSAIRTLKDVVNKASKKGGLPHVNRVEKQQVFTAFEKVFTKRGKEPVKMDIAKMQKEVFNKFRNNRRDRLDPKEVGEVEKVLGLEKIYTKKIGSKLSEIARAEKKLEAENKTQKAVEPEKIQKPSKLKVLQQKIKEPKAFTVVSNSKISDEGSKQGMSNIKVPEPGTAAKETKGFKPSKSGMSHAAFAPAISYNFPERDPRLNTIAEPDSEISPKALISKIPQQPLDNEMPAVIPDWKTAAYGPKTSDLPESSSLPESAGTQNKDIDD